MMTLAQLKALHDYIEDILINCSNKAKDLKIIERDLMEQFKVKDLNDLPETVEKAYNIYKNSFFNLQSLNGKIKTFIEVSKLAGEQDNDEVKWDYFPDPVHSKDAKMAEIIRGYELLRRQYVDFKFYCQSTETDKNFQNKLVFDKDNKRHINLSSDDFSDEFITLISQPLQNLFSAVSGQFDRKIFDKELSSLNLPTLEEEEWNLYLMPSFPEEDLGLYNNSYILVGERLRYITSSGQYEDKDVRIIDINQFLVDIFDLNSQNRNRLHLSKEQVNKFITLNGGHIPEEAPVLSVLYGKDSYTTYLDNQCVHLPIRDTNTPEQNKKAEDFVMAYLKKSGAPESIKPNLKVLFTTIVNQGVFAFITCAAFLQNFSLHEAKILNFGQDYRIHTFFDEKNQIKIQVIVDQDYYNLSNSETLKGINSIIKMEFTVKINVIKGVPYFTLGDKSINCSFVIPLTHPMIINKTALKNPKNISLDKLDVLNICMASITKFLGHTSLSNFYKAKNETPPIVQDFSLFLDLACNDLDGKKLLLLKEEYEFFQERANEYAQQKLNAAGFSAQICKFVNNQLRKSGLSNQHKLRYVYWLQLARELKGSENFEDEIHRIYIALVEKFVDKESTLLIEAAQDDVELYQEIVNPDSFFTTKLKLSDGCHAMMLAKYPSILQGSKSSAFVKILNGLVPQAKLLFLAEFIKNGGDITCFNSIIKNFFDKKFIQYLSIVVEKENPDILPVLDNLLKEAPAATVAALRKPLADVFAVYNARILKQPARELLSFLTDIADKKLVERFGLDFLDQLVIKVAQMAHFVDNVEALSAVPALVLELGKMLDIEINLLARDFSDSVFASLNDARKNANARLLAMNPEKPADQEEKKLESSSSDDDELESLTMENSHKKVKQDKVKSDAESSVQNFKKVEEKAVVITGLSEKSLVISKRDSGKVELPIVPSTLSNNY